MNDEDDRKRKLYLLIVVALLIAFLAFSLAQNAQNTADSNANITNVFEMVVNNTDLGSMGTGERVAGTKYFANTSPVYIEIITHTVNTGQDMIFNFTINDTIVWEYNKKSAKQDEHHSLVQIVPKFASYVLKVSPTIHHYEWREYPILSGRNGTLSINQTIVGGSNYNASYVPYNGANQNITVGKDYFSIISADGNSTITVPNASKGGILIHQEGNPAFGGTDNTSVSIDGVISLRTYDNTDGLNASYTESVDEHLFKINNVEVAAINKTGLNVTNLTATRINTFITQSDVTASRAFGTVYMNQGNKTMFISVSGYSASAIISMTASSDSATNPTTVVNLVHSPAAGAVGALSFMVLPGNRYKITTTGAGPTINSWVEWS